MNYKSYDEIPVWMEDYVLTVSGEKTLTDIPLSDINGFLDGMTTFDQMIGDAHGSGNGKALDYGNDKNGVLGFSGELG